jgi:pimeloyl-ACP methyl ester carboxylesterase
MSDFDLQSGSGQSRTPCHNQRPPCLAVAWISISLRLSGTLSLVGHNYGGITGIADRVPDRVRRLVYWNAFVPNNGECLNDMVPPQYVGLFDA